MPPQFRKKYTGSLSDKIVMDYFQIFFHYRANYPIVKVTRTHLSLRPENRICYNPTMTTQTIARAIKAKKPAVIRKNGTPRYVVLDWHTYRAWEDMREDREDAERLTASLANPKNQKRIPYARVKEILDLS